MAQAQGFLHVDGVEVFNNYRTWVALGCGSIPGVTVHSVAEPCRGMAIDLYGAYTPAPDGDGHAGTDYNAPLSYNFNILYNGGWQQIDWSEPTPWASSDPASDEFLGFWVESFEFPVSTATRTAYPLVSGGSRMGRVRYGQREMPVEFLLVSTTDRGMWYGFEWLDSQMNGESGCGGSVALIRQFCTTATYPLEGLWELHSVGLLDPVADEGSPMKFSTCLIRSASMTLVAGDAVKHTPTL